MSRVSPSGTGWTYKEEVVKTFEGKTKPFQSALKNDLNYQIQKMQLDDYVAEIQYLHDHHFHDQKQSMLKRALDLSIPYDTLGRDTKSLRVKHLTGPELIKKLAPTSMQDYYAKLEADYLEREKTHFTSSELCSWEGFLRGQAEKEYVLKNTANNLDQWLDQHWGAPFLKEVHWNAEEGVVLHAILEILKTIRDWDKFRIPARSPQWSRGISVLDLPQITKTEFVTFHPQAVEDFLENTRPFRSEFSKELENYQVQFVEKQAVFDAWAKDSTIDQVPDILANAADLSKPYDSLGVTTKKVRVFMETGPNRLKAEGDEPLAVIFTKWAKDIRAREQIHFVRSSTCTNQAFLDKKGEALNQPDLRAEHDWAAWEGAFLQGVKYRLEKIKALDDILVSAAESEKRRLEQEAARAEQLKKIAEEKAAAEAAKKAAEEAREAEKKKIEEERAATAKKQEEERQSQLDAAAASVANTQNKMALYQAEMAEIQGKMARGEIDGATFGQLIGGLSAKYFS